MSTIVKSLPAVSEKKHKQMKRLSNIEISFCRFLSVMTEKQYEAYGVVKFISDIPNYIVPSIKYKIEKIKEEYDELYEKDDSFRIRAKLRNDYVIEKFPYTEFKSMLNEYLEHVPNLSAPFASNTTVDTMVEILDLNDLEREFLIFCQELPGYHYQIFNYGIDLIIGRDAITRYSMLLGVERMDIVDMFRDSILIKSSFITKSDDSHTFEGYYLVNNKYSWLREKTITHNDIIQRLFPATITTDLNLDNFSEKVEDIAFVEKIITSSYEKSTNGTNILLWGEPGTGKTELVALLAKKNDWDVRVIGENNGDEEQSRKDRLINLRVAQKLFQNAKKPTILLFDEMEDLMKIDINATFSKAFINRTLENNPVPIIWTSNSISLDRAALRRISYNIHFDMPPAKTRKTIWTHYKKVYDVDLADDVVDHLADEYDITPAQISTVMKMTNMVGNESEVEKIETIIKSLDTLYHYGEKRKFTSFGTKRNQLYDPMAINSDVDVLNLTSRLVDTKMPFTLVLYGPPGTGKTEYARYLSSQLQKKYMEKRGSDLQSMWVGMTEKNIAKAFEASNNDDRVLIINEADSFLQSRSSAQRSWEVSQVNEMLTQMETVKTAFIATTNLIDTLDEAAARRFTFKIKFDFLRPQQVDRLCQLYFKKSPPRRLVDNPILTPGDFAVVKKRCDVLNISDINEISHMLEEECRFKPQWTKPMGFQMG